MSKRGKAFRRHHEKRIKLRAIRILKLQGLNNPSLRIIGIIATTSCVCSCWCCGNARTNFGLTRKELLVDLDKIGS